MQQTYGAVENRSFDEPRGSKGGCGDAVRCDALGIQARQSTAHVDICRVDAGADYAQRAQAVDQSNLGSKRGVELTAQSILVVQVLSRNHQRAAVARDTEGGDVQLLAADAAF